MNENAPPAETAGCNMWFGRVCGLIVVVCFVAWCNRKESKTGDGEKSRNQQDGGQSESDSPWKKHLIPHRILSNTSTAAKGQWQVEVGLVDGRLPKGAELLAVLYKLAESVGGLETHERYFVEFYFPGMKEKNGGSKTRYAMASLNPKPRIIFDGDFQEAWPSEFQGLDVPANYP